MVATGIPAPVHPFFFIHQYKKEQESSGDALGQLLMTMFVAQELNKVPAPPSLFDTNSRTFEHIPLYGVYVIGRLWFFVRLDQKKYHVSQAFDTVKKDELMKVFKMLKAQKEMILELISKK